MKAMMPFMMLMMLTIVIAAAVFAFQGVDLQNQVDAEEDAFHELQEDYFLNNTKQERDTAEAGSELNEDLVQIVNAPSELLRLKLVGVGKILTGIFIILFGILIALIMMPVRLGGIMKDNMMEMQEKMGK